MADTKTEEAPKVEEVKPTTLDGPNVPPVIAGSPTDMPNPLGTKPLEVPKTEPVQFGHALVTEGDPSFTFDDYESWIFVGQKKATASRTSKYEDMSCSGDRLHLVHMLDHARFKLIRIVDPQNDYLSGAFSQGRPTLIFDDYESYVFCGRIKGSESENDRYDDIAHSDDHVKLIHMLNFLRKKLLS